MTGRVATLWRHPIKPYGRGGLGQMLSKHRWRGNIWIGGMGPREKFEWLDTDVWICGAVLRDRERTTRCLATVERL